MLKHLNDLVLMGRTSPEYWRLYLRFTDGFVAIGKGEFGIRRYVNPAIIGTAFGIVDQRKKSIDGNAVCRFCNRRIQPNR